MPITKKNLRTFYTIFVFVALGAFDNIVIGLFPPLFSMIARDLRIQISSLGIISAVNILVTSLASVYCGYLAGKGKRKKYIIIGTLIWAISIYLTSISKSFLQLFIFQFITGIGLKKGTGIITASRERIWLLLLQSPAISGFFCRDSL